MNLTTLTTAAACAALLAAGAFAQTTVRTETREEIHTQRDAVAAPDAVAVSEFALPTDTLVRIRLLDTLDSKNWKEGDQFPYEVSSDVVVDGRVAIPAGAKGAGVISHAHSAGAFGKSGKLELSFGSLPVGNGRTVELMLSDKARSGNEKEHLAAGASLAGLALAGPIGLVGGLFIHGKNISIPAGSEMYVATAGEVRLAPGGMHTETHVREVR